MKRHGLKIGLLCLLLGAAMPALAGCGAFRPRQGEPSARPAALEISIDPAAPENVEIAWDPAAAEVDSAEVRVTGGGPGQAGAVTVTVRLR